MPLYEITGPDGKVYEIEGPPNATKKQIVEAVQAKLAAAAEEKPKEGVGAAFRGGLEGLLSRFQTAGEAVFLSPEEAARRGVERSEEIGQRFAPGSSLDAVKQAYAERGLLGGAGEVISQIPGAFAEQIPNIAATLASAKAGALAGSFAGPGGALIGGGLGAIAPSIAQLFGSGLERQAAEGVEDISAGKALAAAVPGAALEAAATFIPLGRSFVGKILGPGAEQALARGSKEAGEAIARESLGAVLAKGTTLGVGIEGGTEAIQQMLERYQAGLPITSDDALAEYGQAAYGGALVGGPFGALGRVGQRSTARGEVEERRLTEQAAEEAKAAEEARLAKEAEQAEKATPAYETAVTQKLEAANTEINELKEIRKQKDLDPDVKKEAEARLNELNRERKKLEAQLQESKRLQGKVPTLAEVQEQRRAAAKAAAEAEAAEKDRAEAARLGMPLFTADEASRDLFLDKQGQLQASLLPEADAAERQAQEDVEKQEIEDAFYTQKLRIEDRLEQLNAQIAKDPTSPEALEAKKESEKLQKLQKQFVSQINQQNKIRVEEGKKPIDLKKALRDETAAEYDARKKQKTTLAEPFVEPEVAELNAAREQRAKLLGQIKKANEQNDSAKVTKLQTQLQETINTIGELEKQPYTMDLFGVQNVQRQSRKRMKDAYAGLVAEQEKGAQRATQKDEDQVNAEADRLSQVGGYIERLQEEKGVELLGVKPENRARVEAMLEKGSLPPELSQQIFGISNLSLPNVREATQNLEAKLNQTHQDFLAQLLTTGKAENPLLNDNGLPTKLGLQVMRDEIRLQELQKLLARQQKLAQERADKLDRELVTPGDLAGSERLGTSLEQTQGPVVDLEPETQETTNMRDRNVLMSAFQDVIYGLQKGMFSGLRGGVSDPYEIDRNEKLQRRIEDVDVELAILRAQIQAAPQDSDKLQSRIGVLEGRKKILSAGLSIRKDLLRDETVKNYDELLRQAQQLRDAFIERALIEVNAARVAKGLPEVKTLTDDQGNSIAEQFNSFISKAANAKRTLGEKTTKLVDEFGQPVTDAEGRQLEIRQKKGDPSLRPFAKVGMALDTLQEQIEEDIRRAKGEKTLKDQLNEAVEVEFAKPEAKKEREDRSKMSQLVKEIKALEEQLNQAIQQVMPGTPELDLVSPAKRSEILEGLQVRLQQVKEGPEGQGGLFIESVLKKQIALMEDVKNLPDYLLFEYVDESPLITAPGSLEQTRELLRRVQRAKAGPAELRRKIRKKKTELEDTKKESKKFTFYSEEELTTKLRRDLQDEYNALAKELYGERDEDETGSQINIGLIKELERLKTSGNVDPEKIKSLEKQIEDIKKQAQTILENFKKLVAEQDRVITYPKTAKFGKYIDALAKFENLEDVTSEGVAKVKSDIRDVKKATARLTAIDNQLYALSLQPKTEARTEKAKELRAERSKIIKEMSKRFDNLRENTALPDEEANTIGVAKVKLLDDIKAFEKKYDDIASDVIDPLVQKETELKKKIDALRKKRGEIQLSVLNKYLKKVYDETADTQKEISETVKELRQIRKELFDKRNSYEKEAISEWAEIKAREAELLYPYASKLNKQTITNAVNEELKDIDAELGDLKARMEQLKTDKREAEARLKTANSTARSGATPEERSQARAEAKDIKLEIDSLVDALNTTNQTIIDRAALRDAEATKLAAKFAREPAGRYNKSMGRLLSTLEDVLAKITPRARRVVKVRRGVENRVMNMERMRADRTDQLAENIQRSLVGLKKRIKNSQERIKRLEGERLAANTVGRMTTPSGKLLSGLSVRNIVTGRKVSEEFEMSKDTLNALNDEIISLREQLKANSEKPADAKDKLTVEKRKSLEGTLGNRIRRRDNLLIALDPGSLSVEIDRLRAKLEKETGDKKEQKEIREAIAKLIRKLRNENQIYEITKKVTLFGDRSLDTFTEYESAVGWVRENHVQDTPSEMETEAKTKRLLDAKIIEAEQNLAIEMAGGVKESISAAKAVLKGLRDQRAQLVVYRSRKALSKKEVEEGIKGIEAAEKDYEFKKDLGKPGIIEALDIDDITDLDIDTSGGPIEFRLGNPTIDAIDTKDALNRLADIKKLTEKMGIKFEYYENMSQVPVRILKQMALQGIETMVTRVKGGVMPDGTVFVIAEHHNDMLDLEKTLAHELIGHYSFDSLLGKDGMLKLMLKLDKDLATKANENGIENLAERLGLLDQYNAAVAETYAFYRKRLESGKMTEKEVRRQAKIQGLKELVAYTMEKRVDKSWLAKASEFIKEMVRAFRMWLKGNGMSSLAKQTTNELFELMQLAERNFTEGKPMAYYDSNGMVSLSQTAAPAAANPLSNMVAKPSSSLGFLKANLFGMNGMNFRVQFVDRLAALDALVKKGVEKSIIPALKAMDVLYFSRFAGQRNNFAAEYLTNGVGRIEKVKGEFMYVGGKGPSMKDVSAALRGSGIPAKDVEAAFTSFLIARRAEVVGVDKLDYSEKVTEAQVKATLALYGNNTAFQKAADLYDQYNNNLIDLMVQAEALDPAKAARLKNSKYVPYYRERNNGIELVIGTEKPVRIGSFNDQPELKELRGGIEKVLPVFTGAVQNTQMIVDIVLRNMAAKTTAFVLHEMQLMDIRTGSGPATPKANVVRFTIFEDKGGEKKLVEKYAVMKPEVGEAIFGNIPTELVIRGMEGIKTTIPGIVRLMGLPANWLRSFVTKNPRYAVNQVFRDSMAAVLTTGADFTPVVQTLKDMATMNRSGVLGELRGRGVVGGQVIVGASDDADKILRQLTAGKPGWEMAMAKLDEFAMMGDAATRVSMYNSFLKQGLSEREATFATLEAMNFSRRGLSPSAIYASILIPFFNAQVQGLDVLYRAYKEDMPAAQKLRVKQKLKDRLLMMGAFTFAYAMMMEEDEAYKNANMDERYANWFVPTPLGTFRVPIPFELGFFGKAIPEGLYRLAVADDKLSDVLPALRKQFFMAIPGDLPTSIKAPIEVLLNKSFFTDRPIIDARLEGLVKSEQFKEKTPELIKMLGIDSPEIVKKVFGIEGVSPAQVEYLIKGYTGTLPVALLRLLDPVFASGEVVKADMKLSDVPVVGSFFQPTDAGGIINAAYASVQQAQRVSNTYKKLVSEGRTEEARKFFEENTANLSLASAAGTFRQQMGEFTKAERAVRASNLSAEEKRERLDELRKIKIKYSEQFRNLVEQIKRQAD
jgi:hypothetical protein